MLALKQRAYEIGFAAGKVETFCRVHVKFRTSFINALRQFRRCVWKYRRGFFALLGTAYDLFDRRSAVVAPARINRPHLFYLLRRARVGRLANG